MNSLTAYLVEGILKGLNEGVTVLFPGGFKPPHGGHLDLAKRYANESGVDRVIVLIGPGDREGISRADSIKIWDIVRKSGDLPQNISVEQTQLNSPLGAAYEYLESAAPGKYALAASSKGKDYDRVKKFVADHAPDGKYYREGVEVVELPLDATPLLYKGRTPKAESILPGKSENGRGVSASVLRADLANKDVAAFATNYPNIKPSVVEDIYELLSRGPIKEAVENRIKKLRVFDFDDTIAKTDHRVAIKQADGTKRWITPGAFAINQLKPGEEYDFSDFATPIRSAKIIKTTYKVLQRVLKAPESDRKTVILTARHEPKVVADFLKSLGINIPIIALGSGDPLKKKEWIKNQIDQEGYTDIYFIDDSHKNIAAVDQLKTELPGVKIRTQLVKPTEAKPDAVTVAESLLLEGGGAGHLTHPYEDLTLSFDDVRALIDSALKGELEHAQEKLDGQNLMVSYKNGRVVAARNKGHLKNFGENALTVTEVERMFANRGPIQVAFTEAMQDLTSAIERLTPRQKERFFANGKRFVNLEVLYPETANVVPYGATQLRLHHIREYDINANVVGEDVNAARELDGALRQVSAERQKTYKIAVTNPVTIKTTSDLTKMRNAFLSDVDKIQSKYKLTGQNTIGDYLEKEWVEFIKKNAKTFGYTPSKELVSLLVRRWIHDDKSTPIKSILETVDDQNFKNWIIMMDKSGVPAQRKIAAMPVENLFLRLGVAVLKNVEGLVAMNPDHTVRSIKNDLRNAIQQIRQSALDNSNDAAPLEFLKRELLRLKKMGGMNAIVPAEGLVFKYKDKLYKLTGAFAPINQILGYLKF